MTTAGITGAFEVLYSRHPEPGTTTGRLIAAAVRGAAADAGVDLSEVDGLGVSSFTLGPDHGIDVAWKAGLRLRWVVQDPHGGASGVNMLQLAVRAVEAGDARCIVLVAADHLDRAAAAELHATYNRVTRDHLEPLGAGGPNALFAMLTTRHQRRTGLQERDYAQIALSQRRWAVANLGAVYREPMSMADYLASPVVFDPLRRYDCVPQVSGADAIVVQAVERGDRRPRVIPLAFVADHNADQQEGPGTETGHVHVRTALWDAAGVGPQDIDLAGVYDDYPVMVLEQMDAMGMIPDHDLERFLHGTLARQRFPLNTSGGQLSAGQAGAAGGLHFLVEAVTQLRERAGARQVENARHALVTGYGMVLYRFGAMANAVVLEAVR